MVFGLAGTCLRWPRFEADLLLFKQPAESDWDVVDEAGAYFLLYAARNQPISPANTSDSRRWPSLNVNTPTAEPANAAATIASRKSRSVTARNAATRFPRTLYALNVAITKVGLWSSLKRRNAAGAANSAPFTNLFKC